MNPAVGEINGTQLSTSNLVGQGFGYLPDQARNNGLNEPAHDALAESFGQGINRTNTIGTVLFRIPRLKSRILNTERGTAARDSTMKIYH